MIKLFITNHNEEEQTLIRTKWVEIMTKMKQVVSEMVRNRDKSEQL